MSDLKNHWEQRYRTQATDTVSWYQVKPELSLALIENSGISKDTPIIDVGGGASTLVDHLLDSGYTDITVLDISGEALAKAQQRLGRERTKRVHWIEADLTRFVPPRRYALWHDRAVFHFLTNETARAAYRDTLHQALSSDGNVVLAAFAVDGPTRCSGLDVTRYDADTLTTALGSDFATTETRHETHVTPTGATQSFVYLRLTRNL